jgi:hypothetical protein
LYLIDLNRNVLCQTVKKWRFSNPIALAGIANRQLQLSEAIRVPCWSSAATPLRLDGHPRVVVTMLDGAQHVRNAQHDSAGSLPHGQGAMRNTGTVPPATGAIIWLPCRRSREKDNGCITLLTVSSDQRRCC